MRPNSIFGLLTLALLAVAAVGCRQLDPRQQAAAAVSDPGSPSPTTGAAQTPDVDEESDVQDGDVWPPGPGPEPEGQVAAQTPDVNEESDVQDGDVWPPGPGPEPEGR